MTLTIDLTAVQQERLLDVASRLGMDAAAYAKVLISQGLGVYSSDDMVPRDEWEARFLTIAEGLPAVEHHLTDDQLSREAIYEDLG